MDNDNSSKTALNESTTNIQNTQMNIKSYNKKELRRQYNKKIFSFSQLMDREGKKKIKIA